MGTSTERDRVADRPAAGGADARSPAGTAARAAVTVSDAARDAARAAAAAGVEVTEAEGEHANRLVAWAGDQVWGPRGTFAPNELRALSFAGNPVHLAVDPTRPDRPVVGFAVGFLGWAPRLHVHSHQTGVVASHRRRGVGLALKLAQRHTLLQHGLDEMRWTFDPLVRRNTAFNLNALGARAPRFHPDFYGAMSDTVNAGDSSDRLEAVWDMGRPLPTPTVAPIGGPTGPVLLHERDGRPVPGTPDVVAGALVEVPADYEAVRAGDPARAREWRASVRAVLDRVYGAGFVVGAVDPGGYRVVAGEGDTWTG